VYNVVSYLVFCLAGGADDVSKEKLLQFESGDMGDAPHVYGRNFAGQLVDISCKNQFATVNKSATLAETVKLLTTHHRLAVTDDKGKVVNVISQIDIINFLTNCGHWIWSAGDTHVGKLMSQDDTSVLVHVPKDISVVRALLEMYEKKVIAVAVTEPNGAIVANLSAPDLITVGRHNLSLLSLPVLEFLRIVHYTVRPPVTVSIDANLELVFLKLSVYKIHRVWVVNSSGHPTGVLTLTDIMKYLNLNDWFL